MNPYRYALTPSLLYKQRNTCRFLQLPSYPRVYACQEDYSGSAFLTLEGPGGYLSIDVAIQKGGNTIPGSGVPHVPGWQVSFNREGL